jgi:23S rRNA (guanosine2251-2'-O)-methyltransferase
MIIFGKRSVYEAIEKNIQIDKIFINRKNQSMDNIIQKINKKNINLSFVPIEKLNKLAKGIHQGIVARISPVEIFDLISLESFIEKGNYNFVILDNITDTKNFGAIVRTCECFGINGIIVSKSGSSPINGETIKASSGSIFNLPIFKINHIKDAIFLLKANSIKIISADEKSSMSLFNYKFNKKTSIVMGSEGKGISKSILKLSDHTLKIPMKGEVESLNVSVASAIFISELSKIL